MEGGTRASDPNTLAVAANAAAPIPPPPPAGPGNALNERTYQEVEYLKRNLGPILVAALAEICIRRPADPIEYLGHWLLRWRYNEELKRRDVQNALEVVRRKTWTDKEAEEEGLLAEITPAVPPQPGDFAEGFLPSHPYAAPGYGGPLSGDQLKDLLTDPNEMEDEEQLAGEDGHGDMLPQGSAQNTPRLSQDQKRQSRMSGDKRQSQAQSGRASQAQEKRVSQSQPRPSQPEAKRPSQPADAKRPSQPADAKRPSQPAETRASGEGKRGSLKPTGSGGQPPAEEPPAPPQ